MEKEVRFSNFAETGVHVNAVDLNTFIRLFVNHRPVYGIGKNNIEEAFNALLGEEFKDGGSLTKEQLLGALQQNGEPMQVHELEECLQLLVGDMNFKTALPQEITADVFAEAVLGFEEVEEQEEEEGEYGEEGDPNVYNAAGISYGGYNPNEVIPEEEL